MATTTCTHLSSIQILEGPDADEVDGCETCMVEGTGWIHLRMCMTCGVVGCCDDSDGQHARKHAEAEQHPIVRSIEPREAWSYCYVDDVVFNVAGAEPVDAVKPVPRNFNHVESDRRIELWVGSDRVAWLNYEAVGDAMNLTQVTVAKGFEGEGYDGDVTREAIETFTGQGKAIIPSDEFARAFITYRPGLHDVVPASMRQRMLGESDDD